ncbi:MAG TPA: UbiA family prenyltransferase, partial [Flavisolibacter sp.]|nr:UbiA family prenyltransferase [Flavisolibacter sp.]
MTKVRSYLSLIKFSHTIFAMPFALIGFFIAFVPLSKLIYKYGEGGKDLPCFDESNFSTNHPLVFGSETPLSIIDLVVRFGLVILCMIFARSAAMAFNRYLDRRWDALNPRTAIREIPKGIITPKNALLFTIVNCILFIITTWFINRICFYLSPVALAVVLGYSYTK